MSKNKFRKPLVPGQSIEIEPVVDSPIIDDDPEPFVRIDPFETPNSENSGASAVQVTKTVITTTPKQIELGVCPQCGHRHAAESGETVNCINCSHTVKLL